MSSFFKFIFLICCCVTFLFSQQNSGLAEEFSKLEDHLRNPKLTEEQKKKNFESNMVSSVRSTLSKRFANPKKELKELKFQDLQSERREGTNTFYVKYKNYYFQYLFPVDPETYVTSPSEEIVLEKPEGLDLGSNAHKEEKKN
ncbi:MAG: LIC11625 family surface-exposed protein [Leptospira bouyouniensis]